MLHDGNNPVLVAFKIITWQWGNNVVEATENESKNVLREFFKIVFIDKNGQKLRLKTFKILYKNFVQK